MSILVEVLPGDLPGAASLPQLADEAAHHVGVRDKLERLTLVLDAPEFEGVGFWTVETGPQTRVDATLYGSPRDLLVLDQPEFGERVSIDLSVVGNGARHSLDRMRADRWLHRNLLQLEDVLSGLVDPETLPSKMSRAFQNCWDVWTDGRLRLWQRPGLSQAERRRVFYRTFARGGLLLPRHWEVFRDLWEGRAEGQADLLAAAGRLPEL
jgi:hypothetical protein